MTTTRLCLVRHGETDWNAERRLQGQLDLPLNSTGLQQAEVLACALAQQSFDALYVSDLQRAQRTAAPLARTLALPAQKLPALRERHFGLLQGVTLEQGPAQQPEAWRAYAERDIDHDLGGGESLRQFARRVHDTLQALATRHQGQSILLVAHGGVLDMAYRLATAQALDSARSVAIPNAALNWLQYEHGTWSVNSWADRSHLQRALDEL